MLGTVRRTGAGERFAVSRPPKLSYRRAQRKSRYFLAERQRSLFDLSKTLPLRGHPPPDPIVLFAGGDSICIQIQTYTLPTCNIYILFYSQTTRRRSFLLHRTFRPSSFWGDADRCNSSVDIPLRSHTSASLPCLFVLSATKDPQMCDSFVSAFSWFLSFLRPATCHATSLANFLVEYLQTVAWCLGKVGFDCKTIQSPNINTE